MKDAPNTTHTTSLVPSNPVSAVAERALAQFDLQPQSLENVLQLAKWIHAAKWFEHIETVEQAAVIILQGRELGLPAMVAITDIHVIKGKPTLAAALQVAIVRGHPSCEYFELAEADEKGAAWISKRVGRPEKRSAFTLEQAKRMGLFAMGQRKGKDGRESYSYQLHPGWHSQPDVMLVWRAASFHARFFWSDVIKGLAHSTEEMREVEVEAPREVDVTPPRAPEPSPSGPPPSGSRLANAIREAAAPASEAKEPEAPPEKKTPAPSTKEEVGGAGDPPAPGGPLEALGLIWEELNRIPLSPEALVAAWNADLPAIARIQTDAAATPCLPKARTVLKKAKLAVMGNELAADLSSITKKKHEPLTDISKWSVKALEGRLANLGAKIEEATGGKGAGQ